MNGRVTRPSRPPQSGPTPLFEREGHATLPPGRQSRPGPTLPRGSLRSLVLWIVALSQIAGCAHPEPESAASAAQHAPPVAPRHPKRIEQHGQTRVDDYAWLREKDSPEVLAYLHAENAFTQQLMRSTEALQEKLYSEIVGRIQQTDETPPVRRGTFLYYSRTTEGKQYPVYCRKRAGIDAAEEVLLDLNALAEREKFLDLGEFEVSDDGNLLAYSLDTSGFREYTLQIKNLQTGAPSPERIQKVSSGRLGRRRQDAVLHRGGRGQALVPRVPPRARAEARKRRARATRRRTSASRSTCRARAARRTC